MENLIQISGLCKSFPGVRALHDCQFDLRAGEIHALMGENGAGKSTLMKILAGVYQKDTGEILLSGNPIDIRSPRHAQSLGIGIVHQELNLMEHLTAAQNIFIGREPKRLGGIFIDEQKMNQAASDLFKRINLSLDPETPVNQLTVAKQQMVEIAKALSFQSRILIMDEPTAALTIAEIDELFSILRHLKSQGVGIIYISHKMDELKKISDRVTVLRDGEYIGTVITKDTELSTIITMMVGRSLESDLHRPPDHTSTQRVLEVINLNRGKAIQDVSFHLQRGEILGFAGLMGAGRTEVARAIFGADVSDRGIIRVNGRVVEIKTPKHAVAAGICYLSEDRKRFGLALGMSVESNISLSCLNRFLRSRIFLDRRQLAQIAANYVDLLKIKTPHIHQQVKFLSGGNQQKIVMSKWLLRNCDILIFDEPTRGIDIGAKSEIYQLLRDLAAEGKSIIVISSELPEILRLSHRIIVMCEGRITGELSAEEASQEKIMALATRRELSKAA
ncbi:MAG: sugar ABC transporter ATP-binding protein [Alphaproteobacteria bacterium]|nr:sugar ABC transporter ATP-binding protein [Alphaproteobacteria bacterium]